MSEIKVNKLSPRSGTNVTLGDSGDTFTIPSGATLANNGTATGFGDNLEWQSSIVTAATITVTANKGYWINTTSNACTITLPAAAAVGDQIIFTDYARTWGTNKIILDSNGLNYQGNDDSYLVEYSTSGETVNIVYSGATKGWIPDVGVQPITATGGTITTYSGYKVHSFTSSGTFEITAGNAILDILIVAGGGGGGSGGADAAGGGAGGVLVASALLEAVASYTITIGGGGGSKINGGDSSFASYTAKGGGYGNNSAGVGNAGGSGGGGGGDGSSTPHAGGAETQSSNVPAGFTGYGFAGGIGSNDGAGGGGASGVGKNSGNAAGGNGIQNLFRTGSNVYYAGGGGGGGETPGGGAGGLGGGGTAPASGVGNNGGANTGGGGSGADNNTGGSGGSGIVIIRYAT